MLESDPRRRVRVGLFMAATIILLGVAILLLGKKQRLFVRQVEFVARFEHVGGLAAGAPVWLNGVVAGSVEDVILPGDPAEPQITVNFLVEARLARRIRADSKARIRTLGLLGDRYLEVSSGSPRQPRLKEGDEVPSLEPTDVAEVLSQGGDVVTNVLGISGSLRRILERVERGEGILGELTMNPDRGKEAVARFVSALENADAVLQGIREGQGVLGRLLTDPELEERFVADISAMVRAGRRATEAIARDLEREDSMVAALLRDPKGRERIERALDELGNAGAAATAAGRELAEGKGVLGRLMADEEYAGDFLGDLAKLTRSLRSIAEKLDQGEGTAGRLINDSQIIEDLESVVRGVNESRALRWMIRKRRAAGEKAEAEDVAKAAKAATDGSGS